MLLALLATPTEDAPARIRAARAVHPAREGAWEGLAAGLGLVELFGPDLAPRLRRKAQERPLRVETFVDLATQRLLVQVDDPSGLLNRVEVVHEAQGGPAQALAVVPIRDGRRSVALPLGWPTEGRLFVELGSELVPGGALWRRQVAPPSLPPRVQVAPTLPSVPPPPEQISVGPPPWTWVLAGALTVGLVGAAVWQETR
ncbi:MAG: hypothetical protein AAF627_01515 [Myxococcota bacterium]